jgi:hypothetical protein
MGLEAECELETGGEVYRVKALLESRELILRGDFRRTVKIADMTGVAVRDGALHFTHGGTDYSLRLPQGRAETWAKKIMTPPPSLASKLGISPDKPAFVIGPVADAALATALEGNTTTTPTNAAQLVVIAETSDTLPDATALPRLPVWIVYPKGAQSPVPESVVRAHMRSAGWADTKTSAVSERLTALRFHRG